MKISKFFLSERLKKQPKMVRWLCNSVVSEKRRPFENQNTEIDYASIDYDWNLHW